MLILVLHNRSRCDQDTKLFAHPERVTITGCDGVAMDRAGTFYFVSTRSYGQTFSTIYRGHFKGGTPPSVGIYMATRPDMHSAFGQPLRVSAAEGFVEGPTLSPDEKSLYYHRKVGTGFAIYRVTRK